MCGKKHQGTLWKFHISLHSICKWQAWVLGRSRAFCWNTACWEYIKLVMHTHSLRLGHRSRWSMGLTATCYLNSAGLKLMLTAWRLIYDKHLFPLQLRAELHYLVFPEIPASGGAGLEVKRVGHLSSILHTHLWPNRTAIYYDTIILGFK